MNGRVNGKVSCCQLWALLFKRINPLFILRFLQRFAQGLREDYEAVKAGVTVPWSNGPVEGHINRLKMLKRQMFGRAHLDLLSCRFVLAPREGQALASAQCAPAPTHAEAKAA